MPSRRSNAHLIAALITVTMLATMAAGTVAQDATPPITTESPHTYPVSIHAGTCQAPLAQPAGSTADTTVAGLDADSELVGFSSQPPVMTATVGFDGTLEDLTAEPHVVAIHASPEEFGTIVACGEIAGYQHDEGLVIPLRSMSGEQVSGIAVVHRDQSLLNRALEELGSTIELDSGGVTVTAFIIPAEDEADGI